MLEDTCNMFAYVVLYVEVSISYRRTSIARPYSDESGCYIILKREFKNILSIIGT
jgi:hypothetical protein